MIEFEPNEELVDVLTTLRGNHMGWLADEILGEIKRGRCINSKNVNDDSDKYEDYGEEQLTIALEIIVTYAEELKTCWDLAREYLNHSISNSNDEIEFSNTQVNVNIIFPGDDEPLEPFTEKSYSVIKRLKQSLSILQL